jgi:predicted dehydrogenase
LAGQERTSGSNHGTAFATIFNGWDETKVAGFAGTFVKSPTRIQGVEVVKVWDPLPEAAGALAAACRISTVANSPAECCDDVDAVILIDDGSGRQWQYAEYPLRQGVPVFCDKPLAMTAREAKQVADLAAATGTPLMSASSLRFVPDVVGLRQRIQEIGPIKLAVATGPGELIYYGIHALSMVYSVLGGGVQAAHHVGQPGRHMVRLRYENDLETLLLITQREQFPMGYQLQLYGQAGSLQVVPDLNDLYVYLLQAFIDYLATGQEPFPIAQEVELIAALEAGEQSLKLGREVRLSEMF